MSKHTPAAIENQRPLKVLRIDSSSRLQNSVTRQLADRLIDQLGRCEHEIQVITRDVAQGIPFVSEEWINANFTELSERSERQCEVLAYSDALVREIEDADVVVIGTPIYNFGIPAALKAWIDMIARAGRTFRYGENGPVGLLTGKQAYLIIASGGTSIGGNIDFATGYLRHALAFVGIANVEVIAAERLMTQGGQARDMAMAQIKKLTSCPEKLAA